MTASKQPSLKVCLKIRQDNEFAYRIDKLAQKKVPKTSHCSELFTFLQPLKLTLMLCRCSHEAVQAMNGTIVPWLTKLSVSMAAANTS